MLWQSCFPEMKDDRRSELIAAEIARAMEEHARRTYSSKVLSLSRRPRHRGAVERANAFGIFRGICGDTMKIYLRVEDEVIRAAGFETDGCVATVACGSEITELVLGKSVEKARSISAAELLESLGGLPPDHVHCALLAVITLYCALSNHLFLSGSHE